MIRLVCCGSGVEVVEVDGREVDTIHIIKHPRILSDRVVHKLKHFLGWFDKSYKMME